MCRLRMLPDSGSTSLSQATKYYINEFSPVTKHDRLSRGREKRKEGRKEAIREDGREKLKWGRERGDWVGQQTPRGKLSNYAGSARFVAIGRPHGNATFSKSMYTQVNMHAHRHEREAWRVRCGKPTDTN
ncbi:uncharacterized protein LOC117239697 [Bombus vosnesenskii]|uniref:Uncharacterized protein LOC117239697 n=3 Tax=Pyrobombus TaxID=144703 RepID=A0A6J3L6W7_9HYME|nr:uncharacterized protein LOC112213800 [Bombus impatiens]XP_033205291.1 uncharacterized protein LOC117165903 [Bombus vancouverensis nearcticus]XP_033306864.1 uncharacterized protein LOC117209226 [Bombus bifarius]XP_033361368.1 uncharacterized protein LOC117239697 [Bombus vosnesenskii]